MIYIVAYLNYSTLKTKQNYNEYMDNLLFIETLINQKNFHHQIDDKIAQKILMINDYNFSQIQVDIKYQFAPIRNQFKQIKIKIDNLNINNYSSIIQLIDRQYNIQQAIISSNDKFVLYTTDNKLFQYDIKKQVIQSFDIDINAFTLSLLEDNQFLYMGQKDGQLKVYNVNKKFKYQYQKIYKGNVQHIMTLSKSMAIINEEYQWEFKIINLKTNKIISKLNQNNIIDIHYDKDYQILILVHQQFITIITINNKFKSFKQMINQGEIIKSQYCQQSKQLLLLIGQDVLTFWNLNYKQKIIEYSKQMKLLLYDHSYFKYNENLAQLFTINSEIIMIQNHKGDIQSKISHCYQKELYFANF
ncbi:hypothetical protein pb186bvf_018947 [Paramecium bursaria]